MTYLLSQRLGAEAEVLFLGDVASGELLAEHPSQADWMRMIELVWTYRDWPLGTVDASLVALAERLGIGSIATLDHRHFGPVRPSHVEAFELLPGVSAGS